MSEADSHALVMAIVSVLTALGTGLPVMWGGLRKLGEALTIARELVTELRRIGDALERAKVVRVQLGEDPAPAPATAAPVDVEGEELLLGHLPDEPIDPAGPRIRLAVRRRPVHAG